MLDTMYPPTLNKFIFYVILVQYSYKLFYVIM